MDTAHPQLILFRAPSIFVCVQTHIENFKAAQPKPNVPHLSVWTKRLFDASAHNLRRGTPGGKAAKGKRHDKQGKKD